MQKPPPEWRPWTKEGRPGKRTNAAGIGGAAGIIAVWLLRELGGIDVPNEVAGAISTVGAYLAAWLPEA